LLALLQFEGTNRINEGPAGFQPFCGPVEDLALQVGTFRNQPGARAIEDFRMAPKGACRRAWGVEENCVKLPTGSPFERIGFDQMRPEMRPLQVFAQSSETTSRSV